MPDRPRQTRKLYLLALFQLVGGPLVLLPLILFSKLSVQKVAEHGLATGVTQAWQSQEWQHAVDELLHGEAGMPSTQKEKVPGKSKDSKVKIFATAEMEPRIAAPGNASVRTEPWRRGDFFASARSHAPPSPPPKWA